ncbi:hypothetical protein [Altererythrobacter sp. GH1-8]|uniref:hypothetical protein n=1 Tax=Altererythrobacter sp. GH1-8 TaxID=3349333 RepID=UPI00374CCB14
MMDLPPEPPLPQEQVIEQRLVECGLDATGISVKYEDYLQSIEIVIAPNAGATADHFPCIRDASGNEIVRFEDGEAYTAYNEFVFELIRPDVLAMYESRLKEIGLWEEFPSRRSFDTLEQYAMALEEHAGVEPGSTLEVSEDTITFDPQLERIDHNDFIDRYADLFVVVSYASAKENLGLGFVGNGKVRE